jgi:CheY-like chemotaxis protein
MGELLAGAALEVELAANGIEAVAKAAHASYDLILMDLQMPKMDGLKAARAIRLLPGHSNVPSIAMTGRTQEEDRAAGRDAGISDYLMKPAQPARLFAVVLRWLETTQG